MDDRGVDAFLVLLQEGSKGPGPKTEALDALALRPVWLATWEPRAEGFRTLINADGEEALAVFSSEQQLHTAAAQFGWLEADGTLATHRAIGGDILRHAWTREYAFVVIDIVSDHSLEYAREDLKAILREMDSTGPFRTSRPPALPPDEPAASAFPPPTDKRPIERVSTLYSMAPSQSEKLDRLSDLPTKPYDVPYDDEPPTKPRAALPEERKPPSDRTKSSRPSHEPKSEPPATKIEEVSARSAELAEAGTYGAASVIPASRRKPKPDSLETGSETPSADRPQSVHPLSSKAPKLTSDAPTAPAAQPLPSLQPGKLRLPALGALGTGGVEPEPPDADAVGAAPKTKKPPAAPRVAAPSIGDGIKLVELHDPPDETLLEALGRVLRGYFEVEWASYCHVARPSGRPTPAVGLRIADDYRDNVTAIIRDLCDAGRKHEVEVDVLLIDGHDMLRKAREKAFVFYPWKPKA